MLWILNLHKRVTQYFVDDESTLSSEYEDFLVGCRALNGWLRLCATTFKKFIPITRNSLSTDRVTE